MTFDNDVDTFFIIIKNWNVYYTQKYFVNIILQNLLNKIY
jgi:hypothetical protein